jgi:hypothetical protein
VSGWPSQQSVSQSLQALALPLRLPPTHRATYPLRTGPSNGSLALWNFGRIRITSSESVWLAVWLAVCLCLSTSSLSLVGSGFGADFGCSCTIPSPGAGSVLPSPYAAQQQQVPSAAPILNLSSFLFFSHRAARSRSLLPPVVFRLTGSETRDRPSLLPRWSTSSTIHPIPVPVPITTATTTTTAPQRWSSSLSPASRSLRDQRDLTKGTMTV